MDQLRFEFAILPASDGKSNVYCVTSITTKDEKVFAIPEELQSAGFHKELIKTAAYNKVKNSMKKRHQTRKVWITMTEELSKVYVDEDGNLQFGEQYLEEIEQKPTSGGLQENADSLEKLFLKLIENTQDLKKQNLKYIAEKFVIEKFTTGNTNPSQWIDIFERECSRFDIMEDEKKIEILRLFMDKSCVDWYSSMIIKFTLNSDWMIWKNKFCESFANQGWNQVTYALFFKYKDGSLVDYAIKKEKLILDMRRTIDTGTLVDLIAAGLPGFVLEKINKEAMKDTVDLFNEVRKYEHLVNKNRNGAYRKYEKQKINNKIEERNPCKTCENLNKGARYHPEAACWFNIKVYVRVNASTNSRAIRINFKIADRSSQPNLPQATWKIKVTQLECFNTLGKYRDGILETWTAALPSTPFTSSADRDEYLIAPPGCLQYYPDRAGAFESFNYNRGAGPYIANLVYSTCFKKSPDVCGIKFTSASFNLAYRDDSNLYLDTDCQVNPVTRGSAQSEDYLFIPEAETADGLRGAKFCGSSAASQIIASTPPGPLYVHFRSDNLVTQDIPEEGYRFNYNVLNNCFFKK